MTAPERKLWEHGYVHVNDERKLNILTGRFAVVSLDDKPPFVRMETELSEGMDLDSHRVFGDSIILSLEALAFYEHKDRCPVQQEMYRTLKHHTDVYEQDL